MEAEKDEIAKQAEDAHLTLEDRAGKLLLVLLFLYLGAWLAHWFFRFPTSMNAVNAWGLAIAIYILVGAARVFINNFAAEFRVRSQQTVHQLEALELRVAALSESMEKLLVRSAGTPKSEQ